MASNVALENLNLIDLISERHNLIRRISEKTWNENSDIYISNSEWFIIAKSYKKQPTLSDLTKNVDISRQAVHKFVKNLSAKGLVEIHNVEYNKKEKCLHLTSLGEECYEKNETLKAQMEKEIATKIGVEQMNIFKNILKSDWGL